MLEKLPFTAETRRAQRYTEKTDQGVPHLPGLFGSGRTNQAAVIMSF
jgi:hypothetical protein